MGLLLSPISQCKDVDWDFQGSVWLGGLRLGGREQLHWYWYMDSVRSGLRVNSFMNLVSGFFTVCNWNRVCISLFLVLLLSGIIVCMFFGLKEP